MVAARPLVRNLKPASKNLAKATPNLSGVFKVLNHLFNDLGYFPGGGQHGYLWWLAWGDHNARSVFATQDANGDFRQLFLQASCASYTQITQNLGPLSAVVLNLAPILSSSGVCPSNGGSGLPVSIPPLAKDFKVYQQKQRAPAGSSGAARSSSQSSSAKAGR